MNGTLRCIAGMATLIAATGLAGKEASASEYWIANKSGQAVFVWIGVFQPHSPGSMALGSESNPLPPRITYSGYQAIGPHDQVRVYSGNLDMILVRAVKQDGTVVQPHQAIREEMRPFQNRAFSLVEYLQPIPNGIHFQFHLLNPNGTTDLSQPPGYRHNFNELKAVGFGLEKYYLVRTDTVLTTH